MNETTDLAVVEAQPAEGLPVDAALALARAHTPITPAQARIEAVAKLTASSLAKASELQLTAEETKALLADFPDDAFQPGAAGKENLIYIEHAALRDRLTSVLGMGQWAIIVRDTWNEDFQTAKGIKGVRVYCRAMLLVRGCYVGEAIGDMDYYPNNASQNYGDAFEGAKTAALRRCAKELSIGLQAWRKDWCLGWWQRRRGERRPTPPPQQPDPSDDVPMDDAPAPKTPADKLAALLRELSKWPQAATTVARAMQWVGKDQDYTAITLEAIQGLTPAQIISEVRQQAEAAQERTAGGDGFNECVVEKTSVKEGVGKNGKPYTLYGVFIGGQWHNTFDTKLYDMAEQLKDKPCRYTAQKTARGSDLKTLEAV